MENSIIQNNSALSVPPATPTPDTDEIEITCSFKRLVFCNKDNGYTVVEYSSSDFDDNGVLIGDFIATGLFLSCSEDSNVILRGEWTEYTSKRGYKEKQFRVSSYDIEISTSYNAVLTYLSTLKGCGKSTAKKIVDKFGEKTYEVMESDDAIELIAELPRVSRAKAETIVESFLHQNNVIARTVTTKCLKLGLTPNQSQKLFAAYGEDTINVLTSTPYKIIELDGFGFVMADKIARSTIFRGEPFDALSLVRIKAGVLFALESVLSYGHLYLSDDELRSTAKNFLNTEDLVMPDDIVDEAIEALVLSSEIKRAVIESADGTNKANYNYLPYSYKAEQNIAKFVCDRLRYRKAPEESNEELKEIVLDAAKEINFNPSEKQLYAVIRALKNSFSIITGGPGTGKTSIIKTVIRAFRTVWRSRNNTDYSNPVIQLAAPTGRAARRMTEACGQSAVTLHSLLGLKPNESMSSVDLKPVDADLLIVDEFSMVDVFVANHLITQISPKTKVIFVGDAAQLPSVGPGAVFSELISSKCVPITSLTEIFRQKDDTGLIVENAAKIRCDMPNLQFDTRSFLLVHAFNGDDAQRYICQIFENELRAAGKDATDKVQVLTPRRTKVCTSVEMLNPMLREVAHRVINPNTTRHLTITIAGVEFSVGDKIMQLKNTEVVSNGDIGYITRIENDDDDNTIALIDFGDERVLEYTKKDMENIIHSYACTIHKSQGAEFDTVIIPLLAEHGNMLDKKLLYTAMTRAIKRVILVTNRSLCFIHRAIHQEENTIRNTLLSYHCSKLVKEVLAQKQ